MDADPWAARLFASKRQHIIQSQNHQWEYLGGIDEIEGGDDDMRPEFACPYCYEEFEISALCTHLEEEHVFESKGVACPVCALKVPKDMVGHLTLHHGQLFKIQRRRRFRRPSGSTLAMFSKEYREAHLQALLGGSGIANSSSSFSSFTGAADSLLSDLTYTLPLDPAKQDECLSEMNVVPASTHKTSLLVEGNLSAEEREQKLEHATRRANFVQQLVLSAMFGDKQGGF